MAENSTPNEVTFRLPRSHQSVPRSRAALHAVLGGWGVSQDTLDSAELVLSELVTNALRVPVPRDRQVGVRIARSPADGLLRLEVSDAGAGKPEVRVPGDEETGGRGLLLVEATAHRWGVEEREGGIGKTVWAELKAPDMVVAYSDPGFDDAVQEGLDLIAEIKKAARTEPGQPVLPLRRKVKPTSREC
ncbi:ATP-binding protein [Streptomyces bottropensis]|uniref:ATP-binding protein n=1 Tax=Streptomyces bottropensis TaxID=42235 RepID=UPI0036A43A93